MDRGKVTSEDDPLWRSNTQKRVFYGALITLFALAFIILVSAVT
jgi:hypothetical protein